MYSSRESGLKVYRMLTNGGRMLFDPRRVVYIEAYRFTKITNQMQITNTENTTQYGLQQQQQLSKTIKSIILYITYDLRSFVLCC